MIALFTTLDWGAVGQIILIDILLGGDNAVLIAMACRNLPPRQRTQGIILGTAGAILLRVILVAFAVSLLNLPGLHLVGAMLLVWIGVKLLLAEQPDPDGVTVSANTLASAVRTVIVADFVMSLDNVIGIAAAAGRAHGDHQIGLVIFGLLFSVPVIVFGSRLVLTLIERFPSVVWFGGGLLGWIAGGLALGDRWLEPWTAGLGSGVSWAASLAGAVFVVTVAWLIGSRRPAELPHRS